MRIVGGFIVVFVAASVLYVTTSRELSLSAMCPDMSPSCVQSAVAHMYDERGLAAVFRAVRSAADSDAAFRASCIDVMRDFGASMPAESVAHWEPDAVLCNYGFINGYAFAHAMRDIATATSACDAARRDIGHLSRNAYAECFRGIGRALLDIGGPRAPGDAGAMAREALGMCEDRTNDPEARLFCAAGFFNAIGFAMVNERYGLAVDRSDPLWLCDSYEGELAYRCTGNMKWIGVRLTDDARGGVSSIPESYERARRILDDELVLHVVRTLAYEYGRSAVPAAEARADCGTVPDRMQAQCAAGYALGIAKNGGSDSYPGIIDFCAGSVGVLATDLNACMFDAMSFLDGFLSRDEYARLCDILARHSLSCGDLARPQT